MYIFYGIEGATSTYEGGGRGGGGEEVGSNVGGPVPEIINKDVRVAETSSKKNKTLDTCLFDLKICRKKF